MIYYTFSSLTESSKASAVDKLAADIGNHKIPPKGKKDHKELAKEVLEDDEDSLLYTEAGVLIGMLVRTEDIEC
jgi:hypothetical protein